MTRFILLFSFTVLLTLATSSQVKKSENIIIVTMDGLRWQEVFMGADSLLAYDSAASYSTSAVQHLFWEYSAEARRKKLMPFLWERVAKDGMIAGNRNAGSLVNNANPYWFSYPGYNELMTGYPDTAVNSNDKIANKNVTVLESINKMPAFKNRVAVFGSWDVFASIYNEKRSGILVNDGFRNLREPLTDRLRYLNQLQHETPDLFHGSERLDVITFNLAFEYLKERKPRVLHIALGDTDEFAHAGEYYRYLDAAKKSDAWIAKLWKFIQSTPQYANKTTLIITTDHGRGAAKDGRWTGHGRDIPGSDEMWIAAIGPSIKSRGEQKERSQMHQGQIAATIAAILGVSYNPAHKPLPPLLSVIQ